RFTGARDAATPDEIWFLEHPPVFTLGLNASRAHLIAPGEIPVVQVDRGGQVTYHGPGQLVVYPLICLTRVRLGIRDYVSALERAVIELPGEFGILAEAHRGAARLACPHDIRFPQTPRVPRGDGRCARRRAAPLAGGLSAASRHERRARDAPQCLLRPDAGALRRIQRGVRPLLEGKDRPG